MYSSLNRRCDTFFEEMKQLEADNTRLGSQNEALQARFSELIEIRNDFTRLEPVGITIQICPRLLTSNRSGKAWEISWSAESVGKLWPCLLGMSFNVFSGIFSNCIHKTLLWSYFLPPMSPGRNSDSNGQISERRACQARTIQLSLPRMLQLNRESDRIHSNIRPHCDMRDIESRTRWLRLGLCRWVPYIRVEVLINRRHSRRCSISNVLCHSNYVVTRISVYVFK